MSQEKVISEWHYAIIFVFYAFFLLSQLFIVSRAIYAGLRSRKWPDAPGHVIVAEVRKVKGTSPLSSMRYQVMLEYEYEVDGQKFRSGNISIGDATITQLHQGLRSRRIAEKIVQSYPFYSSVNVYYDPQNPARATLKPGVRSGNLILWLITLLIPLLTAVIILLR
ncbi:MAG: DUF3592 domain-containing protein [Anaerolinea sp.]|nr:DUF3592 domain-containing protein [Anaerolinea sp.]